MVEKHRPETHQRLNTLLNGKMNNGLFEVEEADSWHPQRFFLYLTITESSGAQQEWPIRHHPSILLKQGFKRNRLNQCILINVK